MDLRGVNALTHFNMKELIQYINTLPDTNFAIHLYLRSDYIMRDRVIKALGGLSALNKCMRFTNNKLDTEKSKTLIVARLLESSNGEF